ncbi:hypothetical protein JTE90_025112 [Oedothorax gibbosus]|uniref:C2H2-type domain-containing protein n=1 Tax=Oedothorax gibbosus TaxID=931172 RepID=A0AAV6U2A3_9ARAC|nr:hypothetical protein JTE90_025112 [Oedothorax gibbosus]
MLGLAPLDYDDDRRLPPTTPRGKPRKLHKCDFCDYTTLKTDHLRAHVSRHTGEKPYRCSLCSKDFRTKSSLTAHFVVHLKEQYPPRNYP